MSQAEESHRVIYNPWITLEITAVARTLVTEALAGEPE
jgi:hypothetical protein